MLNGVRLRGTKSEVGHAGRNNNWSTVRQNATNIKEKVKREC